jgi:hypothetical protein
VTFSSWAAAEQAIEALNGQFTFPGATQHIMVKLADAKPQDMQRVGAKRGMMDMGPGVLIMFIKEKCGARALYAVTQGLRHVAYVARVCWGGGAGAGSCRECSEGHLQYSWLPSRT